MLAVSALSTTLHTGDVDDVLDDWAELYAGQPEATPFMSPGWAAAWWPHYADGARPLFVIVREGERTVGLAPFVVRRKGPLRILGAYGSEPGDYWDVLAAAGRRDDVVRAVAEALRGAASAWDVWILRLLPPDSPLVPALEPAGLRSVRWRATASPAIELPATFDEYLGGLSGSRRQNLRKHLRRLDSGSVELREVTDVAELPAVMRRWQDFRRRQWEAARKQISPAHMSPQFHDFLLDCLRRLVPEGRALVWEFVHAGEIVGTYLNFADENSFYWYLGGFDPRVTNLGIGKIAIGHGIRTSIDAQRSRYDFTRGNEPYKYWYGAVDRHLPVCVVGNGGLRSHAGLLAARSSLAWRARRASGP